ncbi:hypothetical protein OO17_22845 [Rhodopseudomonas palustris]|uniref:Uncharacterized protein n=1 Tax=Rhodopseudomonas palustris TaxID=1076 RepID=A0A0D7ECB9_RHOPL|nr:hypothetical protein OO17_22845 [Rhodopseudomonas palustris]
MRPFDGRDLHVIRDKYDCRNSHGFLTGVPDQALKARPGTNVGLRAGVFWCGAASSSRPIEPIGPTQPPIEPAQPAMIS